MHLSQQAAGFGRKFPVEAFRYEISAGIVFIMLDGECRQWDEVDAVSVFESGMVAVTHRHAHDVGNATVVSRSRSHPQNIVVAPLYVDIVVGAELVHNDFSTGSPVENIAHDMEGIDYKPLYKIANGADTLVGPTGGNDSGNDSVDIGLLVRVDLRLVQQLLQDIRKFGRKRFADFRSGIFRRYVLAHTYQLVHGNAIPVDHIFFFFLDKFEFLFGIIDEGTQLFHFAFAQSLSENFFDFAAYRSRCIFQHMEECLVFSVQVGQEVFCTFGQIENGFEVDDLGARIGYGRELRR